MKRREFITLLGGAAAAWPLAARAQQPERMRRIGVLMPFAEDHPVGQARLAAFLQGLQQSGWTDGRNLRIEYRWSAGDADRIRKFAIELVALGPDVVMAFTSAAVSPLRQATSTVPIVFAVVADPVGAGYVESAWHLSLKEALLAQSCWAPDITAHLVPASTARRNVAGGTKVDSVPPAPGRLPCRAIPPRNSD